MKRRSNNLSETLSFNDQANTIAQNNIWMIYSKHRHRTAILAVVLVIFTTCVRITNNITLRDFSPTEKDIVKSIFDLNLTAAGEGEKVKSTDKHELTTNTVNNNSATLHDISARKKRIVNSTFNLNSKVAGEGEEIKSTDKEESIVSAVNRKPVFSNTEA